MYFKDNIAEHPSDFTGKMLLIFKCLVCTVSFM